MTIQRKPDPSTPLLPSMGPARPEAATDPARALDVNGLRTALKAIRAAADVMAEGRQYLELRGDLTGEFAAPKVQVQGPPQRIQVLALPKLASGQTDPVVTSPSQLIRSPDPG